MTNRCSMVCGLAVVSLLCGAGSQAFAQASSRGAEKVAVVSTAPPQFITLRKMHKTISVAFAENKLEDVMKYIADATGAELEIMWADDKDGEGLNKETPITLEVKNVPALTLLEKVLDKAAAAESLSSGGNTWQMTDLGPMQVGPKSRLNKYKRVEMYPIDDLLLEVPNFTEAPEFNLQTVLQSSQGGGGQSPFQDQGGGQNEQDRRTRQEKTDELVQVITTLVETEQWVENGGDGASIRAFQGALLVNAPDYIHRQLAGYPYWPSRLATSGRSRRWVGLTAPTSSSQINEIRNTPVPDPK